MTTPDDSGLMPLIIVGGTVIVGLVLRALFGENKKENKKK